VKSASVDQDDAPLPAAEIRLLADQAEAEAAEAEALAAAAGARARAIQLRREAELVGAKAEPATAEAATEHAVDDHANSADPISASDANAVEKPAQRRRGRLHRVRWSTVATAAAVIAILTTLSDSAYMIVDHHRASENRQRVAEFTAAARQGVVTLTSLDYKNAKQGVQRIVEDSTGSFKDDFLKTADDFTKVVEQSKVVSQGTVGAAAVELATMTDDSAVVLVACTSEITNAAGAKQDPRKYRLIMTVTRDGGQLKLSRVEFVP
jgi:Mce-associated membrane protein